LVALLWRRGVGSGSCSGLGLGSGEDGGMRGRSRSCCSRSRSCAASRILSLVISSFDELSFACGGREEARGGYLNAGVKRESSGGIRTRMRLVSRTALSFCCRRIALTIAACFSALTAMSARRRDSKTSARSCEERGRF